MSKEHPQWTAEIPLERDDARSFPVRRLTVPAERETILIRIDVDIVGSMGGLWVEMR